MSTCGIISKTPSAWKRNAAETGNICDVNVKKMLGRPKTSKLVECIQCKKEFYVYPSHIKPQGNCCTQECHLKYRSSQHNQTRKESWSSGNKAFSYVRKSEVHQCRCGRMFIKTKGEHQSKCLYCLKPLIKQELQIIYYDVY
jgi:hypothetical protein